MSRIHSHDFKVTPSIQQAIDESSEQFEHYLKRDPKLEVHLRKDSPHSFSIQFMIHDHGHDYIAHTVTDNFYQGITQVRRKMIRQLQRSKHKPERGGPELN